MPRHGPDAELLKLKLHKRRLTIPNLNHRRRNTLEEYR